MVRAARLAGKLPVARPAKERPDKAGLAAAVVAAALRMATCLK